MDEEDWRALAHEKGPYAVLAGIFAFAFWIRSKTAGDLITASSVSFGGANDPWYHARIIHLTVRHFPATPDFDPYSFFPYGTGRHSGFGGLFDQLIALVALVLGGGNPSPRTIDLVIAYAPAVFGAATLVPVYFFAKRLTDRWAALVPTGLLALLGGQFLSRTMVGSADHQSAEAFFGALAMLGFLYAVETAYAEKPMVADLQDRNWIVLRRPAVAALLGGLAVASYLMTWPPGVMLVFTMGAFVVFQLIRDHLEGTLTEYLALTAGGTMLVTGVLTLLYAKTYTVEPTAFSLLQSLVPLGIGAGGLVMFYLAEYLKREGYDRRDYPVAVGTLIAGSFVLAAIIYPPTINLLQGLVGRVYSFGLLTGESALTVAEIQPASLRDAWRAFGALFYVAVGGWFLLLVRAIRGRHPGELLLLLWSFTTFSAYFTSIRFGYYLAVTVALLSGIAIVWTGRTLLDLDALERAEDLEVYQVLGVAVILIAVLPGNVVAMGGHAPVWDTADRLGRQNAAWESSMDWMQANTPEEPLDFEALYDPPADGDFAYPEGAYGVMSWWDYGHWITFQAHRIPNANPFQQGPRRASAYFLSENETHANLLLEALPNLDQSKLDAPLGEVSNDRLRSLVANQTDQQAGEDTRYVVIDDQMAGGKFIPIATWTGPGSSTYFENKRYRIPGGQGLQARNVTVPATNEEYDETMLSKLYFGDASGLEHYRLVHEANTYSIVASALNRRSGQVRARIAFSVGAWSQARGIRAQLSRAERAGQAVQVGGGWNIYDAQVESRVKTFERVEGARLTGSANVSNATRVFATLRLQTNTGRNFTYVQQVETEPDGDFTMIVPYATDDAVTPAEGGTNASVTAVGNYSLFVGNPFFPSARADAEVPESAVLDGEEIAVDLEEIERDIGNETDGNATGGNTTGNESVVGFSTGGQESGVASGDVDAPRGTAERAKVRAEP